MTRYDNKDRLILAGDLVRSFHFRGARRRKKYYLYHLVYEKEGYLRIQATKFFVTADRLNHSSDCLLTEGLSASVTIMDELEAEDRPKRKSQ